LAVRLSEGLLALTVSMLQSRDAANALTTSLRAQEIFARLSKQDFEWIAWLYTARASRSLGDENQASERARRAADLLASLQQKWGTENSGGYLNRPDIVFFASSLASSVAR
jgi:hypothetical protein